MDSSQGHQLFTPSFVPLRLVDRAPTAVVLMRLADYCSPSPLSTSAPFLSSRQPCRASVANPGQAGQGWNVNTHTHLYTNTHTRLNTLSCALLLSSVRATHVCSSGSTVEAAKLSERHPGMKGTWILLGSKGFVVLASEFVPLSHQSPAHPHLPSRGPFSLLSLPLLLNYPLE